MRLSQKCSSIISGKAKGPAAVLIRGLLAAAAIPYGAAVGIRNRLYDGGLLKSHKVTVPVICIGNITAGGTGKTPTVIWLCKKLKENGQKVAVLTRGYKAGRDGKSDEVQLLANELPDTPVVTGGDRVKTAAKAIIEHHPDVLLMDDGFQHRRLERDLDIVIVDCTCPFGYERLMPRGLLRESARQLKRADVVILGRSDQVDAEKLRQLRQRVEKLIERKNDGPARPTEKIIVESVHKPIELVGASGKATELDQLDGRAIAAFCGIGNPQAFDHMLKRLGADVRKLTAMTDHYEYTKKDLVEIAKSGRAAGVDWLVTTEKDWVKLTDAIPSELANKIYRLRIETTIQDPSDQQQLMQKVELVCKNEKKSTSR